MRVQVVTHMWPSSSRPEHGVFVRDQVEALRRISGVEVEVRRFEPGALSYLRAARALRGVAKSELYDIAHAHYGLSGWSALALGRRRLVVTFHGTDLRHPLVGPSSRLLARLVALPASASARLARARLKGAGIRRRVAVLPCGVDLRRFRPIERTAARTRLGLDANGCYLLFPSRPTRSVKRYDRARELADRLPQAELLALADVHPEDVPLWVNAANAVLVTSEQEGFGLAALEALACDVPVLSTPVGIAAFALDGVEGTLCAPFDVDSWLAALRPHVQAANPRIDGRARAELFSSDRMAARVLAAYRELAGAPDSAGHQRR